MLLRLDANGNEIAAGHLARGTHSSLRRLVLTDANGGIDPVLRGWSASGQEVDPFWWTDDAQPVVWADGSDLAALNMQRGRDHGLPSYNQMRATMGLTPYMSWDDAVFMDGGRIC